MGEIYKSDILIRWFFVYYFKIELEFEKLFFVDGKKSWKFIEKKIVEE